MKKTTFIIALLIVAATTNAQITLENTYYDIVGVVNLPNSGYKYTIYDDNTQQFKLYNTNHSLWKTINAYLTSTPLGPYPVSNYHFSQNLFNSDNLVEVCYDVVSSTGDSVIVINENGVVIFRALGYQAKFVNTGATSFKMIVSIPAGASVFSKIYSLPGTLPCDPCNGATGIVSQNSNGIQMLSNPFPNPTSGKTTINYELPEGVTQGKLIFYDTNGKLIKEFTIDRTFKELQISNEDLSSGTYYYQMQTKNGASEGKKLVIIK